jgi:Periplasmic binding protein
MTESSRQAGIRSARGPLTGVGWRMRRSALVAAGMVSAVVAMAAIPVESASATTPTEGVTTSSIDVGMPYPDLAPVRALGINLNQGNWDDAYQALVANINANGGINGRKIVPYIVGVNPIGTAPTQTACTQLTQGDHVFVALAPVEPSCYLLAHVPTLNATFTGTEPAGSAPNFSVSPTGAAYDPLQFAAFEKKGEFKGKKVALVGGQTDVTEMDAVKSILKKMHVDVALFGIETAPPTDQVAEDAEVNSFVQRMESAGVNLVVGVGSGSTWAQGLNEVQSTFHSPWIATSESSLASLVSGSTTIAAKYMDVLTSSPTLPDYALWKQPAIQKCVSVVRKAYPDDPISTPTPESTGANSTFTSVISACENLALFTAIAKSAGKNLTEKSFVDAGYGLKNVVLAGSPSPISFAPGRPYALGAVYLATYNAANRTLNYSTTPAAG